MCALAPIPVPALLAASLPLAAGLACLPTAAAAPSPAAFAVLALAAVAVEQVGSMSYGWDRNRC